MKFRNSILAAASSLALALPASASDYPVEKHEAVSARIDHQFRAQTPLRKMFFALNEWLVCLAMGESDEFCDPVFNTAMDFGNRAIEILKDQKSQEEARETAIREFLEP